MNKKTSKKIQKPKREWSSAEFKESLSNYMCIDKKYWEDLPFNRFIKIKKKNGDSMGGAYYAGTKKKGIRAKKDYVVLLKSYSYPPKGKKPPPYWEVKYGDIESLYAKMGSMELQMRDLIISLG